MQRGLTRFTRYIEKRQFLISSATFPQRKTLQLFYWLSCVCCFVSEYCACTAISQFLSLLKFYFTLWRVDFSSVLLPSLRYSYPLPPPKLVLSAFWLGHCWLSAVTVRAVHSSLFISGEPWWLCLPLPTSTLWVPGGLSDFHLCSCLFASPVLGCLHTAKSGASPWACLPSTPAPSSAFALSSSWGCTHLSRQVAYWFLETSSFLVFSLTSNFLRKGVEKNSFEFGNIFILSWYW